MSLTVFSGLPFPSFLLQADFSLNFLSKNPEGAWRNCKKICKKNTDTVCFLCCAEYISWCILENHKQLWFFNKMGIKNSSKTFILSAWSNVVSFRLYFWHFVFISVFKKAQTEHCPFYRIFLIPICHGVQHIFLCCKR